MRALLPLTILLTLSLIAGTASAAPTQARQRYTIQTSMDQFMKVCSKPFEDISKRSLGQAPLFFEVRPGARNQVVNPSLGFSYKVDSSMTTSLKDSGNYGWAILRFTTTQKMMAQYEEAPAPDIFLEGMFLHILYVNTTGQCVDLVEAEYNLDRLSDKHLRVTAFQEIEHRNKFIENKRNPRLVNTASRATLTNLIAEIMQEHYEDWLRAKAAQTAKTEQTEQFIQLFKQMDEDYNKQFPKKN